MPRIRAVAGWLLAAAGLGCGRDDPTVMEPSHQVSSLAVSGRVLGPDGRNICRTIGEGTVLLRLLDPEFGTGSDVPFLAQQDLTCPDNAYSIDADPGTAFLRVELRERQHRCLAAEKPGSVCGVSDAPCADRGGNSVGWGGQAGWSALRRHQPEFGVRVQSQFRGGFRRKWAGRPLGRVFDRSSMFLQSGTRYVARAVVPGSSAPGCSGTSPTPDSCFRPAARHCSATWRPVPPPSSPMTSTGWR